MRIVSLLPSATEIVCLLGLEGDLVGVTHECDYPPSVKNLPKVTQTAIPLDASSGEIDEMVRAELDGGFALYTLDMPALERVKPELLITQALCDVCAVAEAEVKAAACSLPGFPRVLNLEPMSLEDVLRTLAVVGRATGRETAASEAERSLRMRLETVRTRTAEIPPADRPGVAFLEWVDPPFNAGHWNPSLIEMAGGVDLLGNAEQPSRTLAWQEVLDAQPDVLFVSCCGFPAERAVEDYPILQRQPGWADLPCAGTGRVYFTDGNAYFSRPGPRLVDSVEILAHALHPEVHPLPAGLTAARRVG